MKNTWNINLAAVILLGLITCCDRLPQQSNQRRDIVLTKTEQAISADVNHFAFNLFRQVCLEDENYFLSPLSASLALSMTANGTAGETASQMKEVLGFDSYSYKDMNGFFKKLSQALVQADKLTEVGLANSIWIRKGFPVKDSYKEIVKNSYLAQIEELDFFSPLAVKTINDWCSSKTKGRIDKIIDQIEPAMVMYLINALYFKGPWTKSFDQSSSYRDYFYSDNNTRQMVDYMIQTDTFPYVETEYARVAELPYGNEAFSMVLVLPNPGVHTNRVVKEEMNKTGWEAITSGLERNKRRLTVSMPKFKYEYEKNLIPTLQAMGMVIPFIGGVADFSNLSPVSGLYISLVKQKTFIEVNEKGTEAAAVTVVGIKESSANNPLPFYINRSFIYIIKEKSTGIILFMGKMSFFEEQERHNER